jgi:methylmalonyl-CoA mutase
LKQEDPLHILEVDNEAVRIAQLKRLEVLKRTRNTAAVQKSLLNLTTAAKTGNENLLALVVEAAKNRATLGEISDALEVVFGRHKAVHKTISGVYSKEIKEDPLFKEAALLTDRFAQLEGRRPRIMIAKLGQDGHDRGAKVVATGYADLGFDVDIGPLFQTPQEAAKQAVENDVHILGISSLAAGHKTLVPQVIAALKAYGREDIMVIVGGVIPPQDYQFLFDAGAVGIFGPGTKIAQAAIDLLSILIDSIQE